MTTASFSLASGNLSQDWSNAGLLNAVDDWSGVPSITGYRGDGLAGATGTDPRTITGAATSAVVVDVNVDQTNPSVFNTGGVAEFALADPTIALNGSGTAQAPSIVCYLDASGRENIRFQCNLRDLDGSVDNAIMPVAVQYRVAGGNWTNAAFVADASSGPSLATLVTPVDVILGADANNAAQLEVRVITTNAVGNDEWIGVDDIVVSSTGAGVDTTAPLLAAFNPADPDDGAVGVAADGNIVLRFNETVQAVGGNVVISNGAGDTRTIALSDASQISFTGATLTINPLADLIAGATYSVTTAAGTIADAAGNAFAGLPAGALDFTVANPLATITIGAIQGLGHTSAFAGTIVRTEGVVTAVDTNGFYLQSATGTGDGDVRTSDAILVFTGSAPAVVVGDLLRVDGTVTEFRPGGTDGANNLTTTELTMNTITKIGTGAFDTVVIGAGALLPPTEIVDNDGFSVYDPAQDGIDFYESIEGMLVAIDAPLVVANTNGFGETFVVASGGIGATGINGRGGITISATDGNPERLQIDEDAGLFNGVDIDFSVGDRLASVTGVIGYSFGAYELLATAQVVQTLDVTAPEEITALTGTATKLTLADYNVENLSAVDSAAKFASLANDIVTNLRAPDIIGVQEIQDADGAGTGSDLSGAATAAKLIAAITAAGGPTYSYIEVAPATPNSTGGEPNGNIRNGYLYNDARVDYVAGSAALVPGPYAGTRSPLAADFVFNGQVLHLVNVHSTSRLGSDEQFGRTQPPIDAGDAARTAQAQAVTSYVAAIAAGEPGAKIAVLGDFNGFTWEPAVQSLVNAGFTDLVTTLPAEERYSYVFDGNSQSIDHILASASLAPGAVFDPVRVNSALFADDQISSDHDPLVTLLDFGIVINGTAAANTLTGTGASETINGLGGNDALSGRGGDDTIDGGTGNDRITGGAGADRLTGGTGNDQFVFNRGDLAGDIVLDFDGRGSAAGDRLNFIGFGKGAFLTNVGTDWTLHYGAGQIEAFKLNVSALAVNDVLFG